MVLKTIINRIKTYAFAAEYAEDIYTILRNKQIPPHQSAAEGSEKEIIFICRYNVIRLG